MIIREAILKDSKGISKVIVDTWRSTYKNIMPQEFLNNMSYEKAEKIFEDALINKNRIILVVENSSEEIIGIIQGGKEREGYEEYQGEIYAIYVMKEHQKKGLGKKLIHKMAKRLILEEMKSMVIWVLANNNSRRFYEKLGGIATEEKYSKSGGKRVKEIGDVWKD